MEKFFYTAKKGLDTIVKDVVEAESLDNAIEKISALGYVPIDVDVYKEKKKKQAKPSAKTTFSFSRRVKPSEVADLTRQLFDLIDADVPLLKVLAIMSNQARNPYIKKIFTEIRDFVKDGGSFSSGLAQYKDVFSPLYVNLIKSGELSGDLNVVLGRLADFLDKDQEIVSKAKASLIYPTLIMSVGFLTIFVLLTFVIPRLTAMFDDLSQALPWPTVFLTSVSGFLAKFWWVIVLLVVGGVLYLRQVVSSKEGKLYFDRVKLKIPIIGTFIKDVEVSRFARTLATLLEGGVAIVEGLSSVAEVLTNEVLKNEIQKAAGDVSSGKSLQESLRESSFFPETALNMIVVGEESGRLPRALYKLAIAYEKQADQAVKVITSLLEPALIVFIGSVVGFVVIAMLLPIFQMNLIIK